jgi:hypothetical protein
MSPDRVFSEAEKIASPRLGFCLPLYENGSRLTGIFSLCGDVRMITLEQAGSDGLRVIVPPLEKVRRPAENAATMLNALSHKGIVPGRSNGLYLLFERGDFFDSASPENFPDGLEAVSLENGSRSSLCPETFVFLPFLDPGARLPWTFRRFAYKS